MPPGLKRSIFFPFNRVLFFKRYSLLPLVWNHFCAVSCMRCALWAGKHTRTQRSISNWFISNIYRLIVPDTPRTTRRVTEFKNTNCQCIIIASVLWPALVVGTMIDCVTTKCGTTVSLRLWMSERVDFLQQHNITWNVNKNHKKPVFDYFSLLLACLSVFFFVLAQTKVSITFSEYPHVYQTLSANSTPIFTKRLPNICKRWVQNTCCIHF